MTLKQSFQSIEIPETLDLGWIHFTDLKRTVKHHFDMMEHNPEKSAIYKASENHLKQILKYLKEKKIKYFVVWLRMIRFVDDNDKTIEK